VLGHVVLWGEPTDDALWRELDDVLKTTWPHPLGGRIGVDACAIDSRQSLFMLRSTESGASPWCWITARRWLASAARRLGTPCNLWSSRNKALKLTYPCFWARKGSPTAGIISSRW